MKVIFNKAVKLYLKNRYKRIEQVRNNPHGLQQKVFQKLMKAGEGTLYGSEVGISSKMTQQEYSAKVPIVDYECIYMYIEMMLNGQENILWPHPTETFAQSSGTTNDRSKYIPMPKSIHYSNHVASSWDTMSIVYEEDPDCKIFQEKSTIMGGALKRYKQVEVGDVSAILLNKMHWAGRPFFTPDFGTATLPDWEEKIDKMANQCKDENVVMLGGVPTWTLVLCQNILEITGKQNMHEVWPNLKYYMHGGVGFEPYKSQFEELFPAKGFKYYEIYNASEGYFAVSDTSGSNGMLLLLDNDIYYEFISMVDFNNGNFNTKTLKEVITDHNYAMVITTSAGLWRYIIGDTIEFTSLHPFRVKVTGRTKQFINTFGEEVMVANTDAALKVACDRHNVKVNEYTIAPIYMDNETKGGHKWVIEFVKEPNDIIEFETTLDESLRRINSDYDAKRTKDMAMVNLKVKAIPTGTFHKWMRARGKYGGQNKVPRLSNSTNYVDELLKHI